jgi:hypothetical protein
LEPLSAEVVAQDHADTVLVICRRLEIQGLRVRARSVLA